jgi:hypothetical protein
MQVSQSLVQAKVYLDLHTGTSRSVHGRFDWAYTKKKWKVEKSLLFAKSISKMLGSISEG